MKSYVEMEDRHEKKERNPEASNSSLLSGKTAELQKLKEKLMKAKDDAVQSWLDSRPLIDVLERLQRELASIKSQATIYNTTISELQSQIENTGISIRSKKEEELKIQKIINRINQALDNKRDEMEQLKTERDDKHRTRMQLKQVLRLRKQSLQALQLTLRAIRLESEAYGASAAEAHRYINCSQIDDTLVKLMQEDYQTLIRRAKEETSLAEWRIAVAVEQKYAAEESRNSCTRRFQNLHSKGRTRKRKTQSNGLRNQTTAAEVEGRHSDEKEEVHAKNGQNSSKKYQGQSFTRETQKKLREQTKGLNAKNNNVSKKKKTSLLSRLRMFLLQKIRRCLK